MVHQATVDVIHDARKQSPDQSEELDLRSRVDSKKLEHGCKMIYAGFASFFGLALEDGHVPTFCSLL